MTNFARTRRQARRALLFPVGGLIFLWGPRSTAADRLALPGFDIAAYERPRLVAEADAVGAVAPRTIVETVNPRSAGGPQDWSSEGDYWWPDPKNPEGPYVQRDGLTNPDNFTAHRRLMLDFVRIFDALAVPRKKCAVRPFPFPDQPGRRDPPAGRAGEMGRDCPSTVEQS